VVATLSSAHVFSSATEETAQDISAQAVYVATLLNTMELTLL
jgi:hypothetical protein